MCLRVLRVSGMPHNVDIWVDDGTDCVTIYIDERLITERGALALQSIFRTTIKGWQRADQDVVLRALAAVTG